MKKVVTLLSLILSAPLALAATDAQVNEAIQAGERLREQERQSLERQREAITPEKRPSGAELRDKLGPSLALPAAGGRRVPAGRGGFGP